VRPEAQPICPYDESSTAITNSIPSIPLLKHPSRAFSIHYLCQKETYIRTHPFPRATDNSSLHSLKPSDS
jgi:hypothetical protein